MDQTDKQKNNMIKANIGNVCIEMPKDARFIKIAESLLTSLKTQIELEKEVSSEKDENKKED